MPVGMSSAARFFQRDGTLAKAVSGGLYKAASRVGGGPGPRLRGMAGLRSGSMRSRAASALATMGDYPRRTAAGGAGALGLYGASRRRRSPYYPMY
jgi:hypothetical protein